jgi:hypothetical protein
MPGERKEFGIQISGHIWLFGGKEPPLAEDAFTDNLPCPIKLDGVW